MTSLSSNPISVRARTLALTAALLGWMFDGFEMGLFPVVSRPALMSLLASEQLSSNELEKAVSLWNGIIIAGFLIGAATGGVIFGWLGDRIGRVRAMSLSILTYALVSGLGAFATSAWQVALVRFVAALGMGGEWSLGVALVMEVWGGRSRALLAGMIGAAANAGFAAVAVLSMGLSAVRETFSRWGFSESWVEWRLLMLCGVFPAVLTLFLRLFVPESNSWLQIRKGGATSAWATKDLLGVFVGVLACGAIIAMWSNPIPVAYRAVGTIVALFIVGCGYLYPVLRYLSRSDHAKRESNGIVRRMLLGAVLSGIPLLGTWAAVQWAPTWADQLVASTGSADTATAVSAKAYTQLFSAVGAIGGGFAGALLGGWLGRRHAYFLLCGVSLASVWLFYQADRVFDAWFLATVFLMGASTASFYGWLPLYLPELFPTKVRAFGQGFSFNFGRIIAAIGALQTGAIMGAFGGGYPQACTWMSSIYLVGAFAIWLAPETKHQPLPE